MRGGSAHGGGPRTKVDLAPPPHSRCRGYRGVMAPFPRRGVLRAPGAFWAQVGLGVLAGTGTLLGVVAIAAAGPMAPVAVALVALWL